MKRLFSWGCSEQNQLGFFENEQCYYFPKVVDKKSTSDITKVSCGFNHTLILFQNGKIYTVGNNDFRKLGYADDSNSIKEVPLLESHKIVDISAGHEHSAAVNDAGKLFMWGRNDYFELGRDSVNDNSVRIVPHLSLLCIAQVSCGTDHTVALTKSSNIYSWGQNDCGQLGLGHISTPIHLPNKLESLVPMPIKIIKTGDKFTAILTPSGAIYSFGRNEYGQLGRESSLSYDSIPLLVKHLRKQPISYISLGQNHVAALSYDGGVFTWGFGRYGQLGLNNFENQIVPCKVADFMGCKISQVECGINHTLAYEISTGKVYAFGCNDLGQLGVSETLDKICIPTPIKGSWASYNKKNVVSTGDLRPHIILRLFAGGNQSMVLAEEQSNQTQKFTPLDYTIWDWNDDTNISVINPLDIQSDNSASLPTQQVLTFVDRLSRISEILFNSMACMSASFLDPCISSHINISHHGFNMDLASEVLGRYFTDQTEAKRQEVAKVIRDGVLVNITTNVNYPNLECMRFFLFLPSSTLFDYPNCSDILTSPFCAAFNAIPTTPMKVMDNWIGNLKPRHFKKFCKIGMNTLNSKINSMEDSILNKNIAKFQSLLPVLNYLKIIHSINERCNRIVHYNTFYIPKIIKVLDLERAYEAFLTKTCMKQEFSIFNYPFLFDGITKATMMKIEAKCMMRDVPRYFSIFNIPFALEPNGMSSYHITVRRDNILADTITQLQNAKQQQLKKPLRVNFYNEDAFDEGGVVKEMFLLIVKEVLNPDYGLFEMDPESRLCWFNKLIFEDTYSIFNAIGRLFGLAIYNNILINLHFPLVMFKKLLNEKPVLDDLIELKPTIGKSLQYIIDYDLPDFEDTFLLNFTISIECYGEMREIDLKPNGKNIPVTRDNRIEYIDLYVDYMLNKNVQEPFRQFKEGFMFTMQGVCLNFFKPIELQEVMVGSENYDWTNLRSTCQYLGEYWDKHKIIEWFWKVFFNFTIDQKKMFLRFLTGCERIPIEGMNEVKIKIQPVNVEDSHLPVAHTCYNLLDLPKYSSEEILKEKLAFAIEHNEGFALV